MAQSNMLQKSQTEQAGTSTSNLLLCIKLEANLLISHLNYMQILAYIFH